MDPFDAYDMLEAIEQGYDDDYKWVNQEFVSSVRERVDSGKLMTKDQMSAIESIYNAKQKKLF